MKTKFLAAVLVSLFSLESWCQNIGDVMTDQRAKELVAKMTLEEKCDYIGGARSFVLRPIERLGIPEIHLADGPQGVRNWTSNSTLYPCGILTAATWNKELAYEYGEALGRDARARGVAFILGPGVNIYRSPLCGRNYEYFGEDPYLTSETAKSYILGVQSEGVIATIKHFAANNQEWSRHHASSDVDERTLHEIYFPAFRKAVQEAHVGAVMDSYNLIYGVHSSENRWMNIDVLRNMWGFDGILMSDWTSVYSSTGAANGGLDLECPKGVYFTKERLIPLIECGLVSEDDIDLKVYHILHTLNRFGLLDRPALDSSVPQDNPENDKVALKVAEEGIVMLENRNSELPFGKRDRVLVLGANAEIVTSGGGSGLVKPYNSISVAEGLRRIHGEKYVEVLTEDVLYEDILPEVHTEDGQQGFSATFYCNKELSGEPVVRRVDNRIGFDWGSGSPVENVPEDGFSVRWDGKYTASSTGMLRFVISGDDGYRLLINGVKVGGDWGNHSISSRTVFYGIEAGKEYHLRYEFYDNLSDAKVSLSAGLFNEKKLVTAAERADRVVYCAGFNSDIEGEGFDRPFRLPKAQTDLIKTLTELNPHVTVVVNAGGGVDFNGWSEDVESILMAWYAGQQGGTAVAEVLVGKVSPSGKLPISIEDKWEDNPAHDNYYDNTPVRTQGAPHKRVEYREGVFIGYRGYDRNNVSPRYPFGYGLSYAKFEYSDLKLKKMSEDSLVVTFSVANTGAVDAFETAQVYVRDVKSSAPRPLKELKAYDKKLIQHGKSVQYRLGLGREAFSFYDVKTKAFKLECGDFEILVGGSSAALPLRQTIAMGAPENAEFNIVPDTVSVIRNPLNGWVMYLGRNWDEHFWETAGYDSMPVDSSGHVAKVSDYCGTAYIRLGWSYMESEEGKYFWNDPESRLYKLLKSVQDRGLRLAFRIVVDGRDQGQNTPMYVIDAGAKCFVSKVGDKDIYTPYPDDPVFQEKYSRFIKAFAERYDSTDEVDFIDAYGLGKWGEAHSMRYMDSRNKIPVYEWITDLYSSCFKHVPLVINYHRVLAQQTIDGWEDAANPDSEGMIESAVRKGYILRHDAFGMNGYYMDWEKSIAARWKYRLPIIFEGGWITGNHHRYWIDPSGNYRQGHPEDVRRGEIDAAREAHVNMMDFRVGEETRSWFRNIDLVQEFVREGGYRLYPSSVSLPTEIRDNEAFKITHTWENLGWGYCPNNISQWNYRYKPAFALQDKDGKIVKVMVDMAAEPSDWIKGQPRSYVLETYVMGLAPGEYEWLVGLVDTHEGNEIGLNMSVPSSELTPDGWMRICTVNIQ